MLGLYSLDEQCNMKNNTATLNHQDDHPVVSLQGMPGQLTMITI
jgi:hypothetical protein